ncbi:MAG: hypothetical protein WA003_14160, partial [Desulfuromonadaceae bacterium]
MSRIRTFVISAATALALLVGAACSPVVNYPGKQVAESGIRNGNFAARDGALLPLRSWLPKDRPVRAVVVGLHGFNDYSNS